MYIVPLGSRSVGSASHHVPQPIIPTGDLIELEDEMHNFTASSRTFSGHYDSPRSRNMKVKSQSSSKIGHPVPKPRQKLPPKAASVDALEDNDEYYARPKQPPISSQYSTINAANFNNPAALVVTSHPDKYITSNRDSYTSNRESYYENIGYEISGEQHYVNTEGTRFDSTAGELVIQSGGRADAYARTSFVPYAENNGAAAMTSNHPHGHDQFLQPRDPLPPVNAEIRYPPPLQSCALPQEGEKHQYDILRYVPHNEIKSQPLPTRHESNHNSTPPSSPHIRAPPYAHLIDDVKDQLPQASEELCVQYLTKNKGNIELTLQDLKVHILMDMGLENANMESCRKALSHCQWKLDRAAEWLIEQSFL